MTASIPFPSLRRVKVENGSYIDPPLDQAWSELDKLRWQCAVVRVDNGGEIALDAHESERGGFSIVDRRRSIGEFGFHYAWTYLNGISHGLSIAGFEVRP